MAPNILTDIQSDWDVPQLFWYKRLAQDRTLISFDTRGGGASDRDISAFSLDTLVGDLETVVDHFGVERFPLIGVTHSGPVAISYAVRHPERVSQLVLFQAYADAGSFTSAPKMQAARALLAKDWESFLQTVIFFEHGWMDKEASGAIARHFRSKTTQETLLKIHTEMERINVTDLLGDVESPTLVITRRHSSYPFLEAAKVIASRIKDSQLVITEGERAGGWDIDSEEIAQMIEQFTAEPGHPREAKPDPELTDSALTARESEILTLVAQGHSNKEIAADLSLSVHTVERHLANIYAKIGARGRADAISYAHKNSLA